MRLNMYYMMHPFSLAGTRNVELLATINHNFLTISKHVAAVTWAPLLLEPVISPLLLCPTYFVLTVLSHFSAGVAVPVHSPYVSG